MRDTGVERDQQRQRREYRGARPDHRNDGTDRAALGEEAGDAETNRENRRRYQMQRHRSVDRAGAHARQRPAGQHQQIGIAAHRPFQEYQRDEAGGDRHGGGGGLPVPGHDQRAGHQQAERHHRGVGMKTAEHDQRGAEQIGRQRAGRDALDLAGLGRRAVQQAADHQQRGEDESGNDVEGVRRDLRRTESGQNPQGGEGDRGDRQPAPQPQPCQAEIGGGDHREIEIQRPVIGLARGDQDRGDESRRHAEPGQRGPMQQGRRHRGDRDQAEQDEGGGRDQEAVQRIGGVDGGEGDGGAGRGQDRRNIGDRQRRDRRQAFVAAAPFAGRQQRQREQPAQQRADAGAKQPGLDRIAHHEETAQRQRQAAHPHHPAGADAFLETGTGRLDVHGFRSVRGGRGRCGVRGHGRRGLAGFLRHHLRHVWRIDRPRLRHWRWCQAGSRFVKTQTRAQRPHLIARLAREQKGDDRNNRC
jgi:hypothetical protein